MADKIEIFISYAQGDEKLCKEIENQLRPLERTGRITIWHRQKVIAGRDLQQEIDAHLKAAHIILLLISPDYIASDDLYDEMERAMQRRQEGQANVIPVLLSPVHWEDSPCGKLKPLPANKKPVSQWDGRGEAFYDIFQGIKKVVDNLATQPQAGIPSAVVAAEKSPPEAAAMHNQPTPHEQTTFDVFLCHNSADKPDVKEIAKQLIARGVKPWLDEWELRPGLPWQPELEKQIKNIKSAAVLIGKSGRGPWQSMEIQGFLREFVKRQCPIIPVILADGKGDPDVPLFLGNMTWIDFRQKDVDPIERLVWGITGKNPHHGNVGPTGCATRCNTQAK